MTAPSLAPRAARVDQLLHGALTLARSGDRARALQQLERALPLDRKHRGVRNALGVLRLESGDCEGAIALLAPLAREVPNAAGIQLNLGNAMVALGRANDAIPALARATELDAQSAASWYGLGRALQIVGRAGDCEQAYNRAIALDPTHSESLANIAAAYNFQDRYPEAEAAARAALMLVPAHPGAHVNRAIALLAMGQWRDGWAEYEWREATSLLDAQRRTWSRPRWNGEDIRGTTLLVHAEQGFGDTLQFARYLPLLRARGARVVLQCPHALVDLLRDAKLADDVIAFGSAIPAYDWQVPLTGVPHRLGDALSQSVYVSDAPYVSAQAAASPDAIDKSESATIRAGIVWAGSGTHINDMHRSCGLHALYPLLALTHVEWSSLQSGPRAADLVVLPPSIHVRDLCSQLTDFSATAEVIATLDVVITVDSAVAHLAGAMGKTCWLLLPRVGMDWRWASHNASHDPSHVGGRESDGPFNTPWYASVRCVRQSESGDWAPTIRAVKQALLAAGGTAVAELDGKNEARNGRNGM